MKKILHKKIYIIIFLTLIVAIIFANIAYASYVNKISAKYETLSGEMICNIDVDKNDSYKVNGIPYVIVTVKNYDKNDNITAVAVDYSLTIKNKEDCNGTYIWKKVDEQDENKFESGISEYASQGSTDIYSFGNEKKEEDKFKIFIKTASKDYENVKFNIELNSTQKNMQ